VEVGRTILYKRKKAKGNSSNGAFDNEDQRKSLYMTKEWCRMIQGKKRDDSILKKDNLVVKK